MCSDGYKLYGTDVRADQQSTNVNATNPVIINQQQTASQPLDFAMAWQAERSVGSSLHDIYARFFNLLGFPKGAHFRVNAAGSPDATNPALAVDSSNNIYVAWEEYNSSTQNGDIKVVKYNFDGTSLLAGPVTANTLADGTERHEPTLAVNASGHLIVAWWERKSDGTQPEAVFYRRLSSTLSSVDVQQKQVNEPPEAPPNVKRAVRVGIAADASTTSNRFAVTWWANVNDRYDTTGNIFAHTYNASANHLKRDHRIDLAPRTALPLHPRITRGPYSPTSALYAYAWRDNRLGRYNTYTRLVSGLP